MSNSLTPNWQSLLDDILRYGNEVSPRGKRTKELAQRTLQVDLQRPVLTDKRRKLSYQGMAAEAYWICSGDGSLAGIAPYLPRMAEFSDDGVTLSGAYGPRIQDQLTYVVDKLYDDPDTRQATLTLWDRNPAPTKDYPCTVAMDFKLRRPGVSGVVGRELNMHVFMRSSDAWLGVPYDVFSFSMVAHLVCGMLNHRYLCKDGGLKFRLLDGTTYDVPRLTEVRPGTLYLTAASSHLYEENWLDALGCLGLTGDDISQYPTPQVLWTSPQRLLARLDLLRKSGRGDRLRWWESGQ